MRQNKRSAHELIGFARIDTEPNRQLNGLIELRESDLFDFGYCCFEVVFASRLNLLERGAIFFPCCFIL